jgi:hypothetical protein
MQFIRAQIAWMVAAILGLSLLGALSYVFFFVLSFIGLLVVTYSTAPVNIRPAWRARLKWLILVGFIGYAYVTIRRILELLPPGIAP